MIERLDIRNGLFSHLLEEKLVCCEDVEDYHLLLDKYSTLKSDKQLQMKIHLMKCIEQKKIKNIPAFLSLLENNCQSHLANYVISFRGNLLNKIKNYSILICTLSEVKVGFHQGLVPSPLLFIIFILTPLAPFQISVNDR